MSRKIKLLIVVSLILNVLMGGVLVGQAMKGMDQPQRGMSKEVLAKLPENRQKEFRQMVERMRDEGKELRSAIKKQREETMKALQAKEFDEKTYQTHVETLHRLYGQRQQQFANEVKKLAKTWSVDERKLLADVIRKPPSSSRDSK